MNKSSQNQWIRYAEQYKVSVANAIRDRDYPMSRTQCIKEFLTATGRYPSEQEIKDMSPDNEQAIAEQRRIDDQEDFDMGRR